MDGERETSGLADLMVELVQLILDEVDPLALPVCRAVCARWRHVIVNHQCSTSPTSSSSSSLGVPALVSGRTQLAFDQALAQRGWVSVLRWARTNGCRVDLGQASFWAAHGDQRPVLEWLRSGCIDKPSSCPDDGPSADLTAWAERTCKGAAFGGHRELIAWLRSQGDLAADGRSRAGVCGWAARGGHLDLLWWLRAEGFPCDEESVCSQAAAGGHLNVLQWALANGFKLDAWTAINAAENGHLEVLQWVRANVRGDLLDGDDQEAMATSATRHGHLDVLRWLHAQHYRISALDVAGTAAECGELEVLQWLRADAALWAQAVAGDLTCEQAAAGGNTEVLRWLREQGCPWGTTTTVYHSDGRVVTTRDDLETCTAAARHGRVETLEWAHANGAPFGESTCAAAARSGHFSVLRWLHAKGCAWDEHTFTNAMIGLAGIRSVSERRDVLEWLRAARCPWSEATFAEAAYRGCEDVIEWLHANGCPWDGQACARAAGKGHLATLKWLRAHGCPWDRDTESMAIRFHHADVVEWVHANGLSQE